MNVAADLPDGAPARASARKEHARVLFRSLPARYDFAGALLSFGQDPRWRRALVGRVGAAPDARVLDVATGTGLVAQELVRRYGCTVVGIDQSPDMLAAARSRLARESQLATRVSLVQGEAERLPFADGEFDHLTFTYLLRYVDDPPATLSELARVVAGGGTICSLEFGVPARQPWRRLWGWYTRLGLPLLGRLFSREWASTGRFLAFSIPEFYEHFPIERLVAEWHRAGIESVQVKPMSFGAGVIIWGTKSGERTDGGAGGGWRGREPDGHADRA
jgi:demethylmenaquinone methyltransferase/2-methoxy-6-polyprenyl-1,4-benzoquinol methylase